MNQLNFYIGQKFGKLTVICRAYIKKGSGTYWICQCECGELAKIGSNKLSFYGRKTCGKCSKVKDIVGKRSGMLVVKKYIGMEGGNSKWECECDCGNIVVVLGCNLDGKNTRSCGCMTLDFQEETNIQKYGCKSTFQNKMVREKFKTKNIKKYGVPYPAQNAEISLKQAKSSRISYIRSHWLTGEELVCVGSYEKATVEYFNANHINFEWQSMVFRLPNGSTYRPDCYLPDRNIWVEIKGYFREDARYKWDWFHWFMPNSELWNKKKLIDIGVL